MLLTRRSGASEELHQGSGSCASGALQGTLLLQADKAWATGAGAGSAGQQGSALGAPVGSPTGPSGALMIEDCLAGREVVALPNTQQPTLVFPLMDCSVLVGLLVVEVGAAAGAGVGAADGSYDGAGGGGGGGGGLGSGLLPSLCSGDSVGGAGSVELRQGHGWVLTGAWVGTEAMEAGGKVLAPASAEWTNTAHGVCWRGSRRGRGQFSCCAPGKR